MRNLTDKQLEFARWYLKQKNKFYKIIIIVLVFINLIIWGIAIYQVVYFFKTEELNKQNLKALTTDLIDFSKVNEYIAPNDLVINKKTIITNDRIFYDFIALINNPNKKWRVASYEYYFSFNGKQTDIKKDFILPNQEKYIFSFNQPGDLNGQDFEINISNINWKRVRPTELKLLEILDKIEIKDVDLIYSIPEGSTKALPSVFFNVKNNSIYDFYEIDFIIALYSGKKIVGLNALPVKKIMTQQSKSMDFVWKNIPTSTSIDVRPSINLFDETIFVPVI
ncbi:hypothetical protein ISS06_01035 [Patescibacteria group bacterium]|nr:hypothetical protein [Patescibacteria group bacterium]